MLTELIAEPCELWYGFDPSIVARSYAQFTAVLAGFAFVVINLVLDRAYRRRGEGRAPGPREAAHETQVGLALVCAFLGLVLTTLRYSLLAGESGCAITEGRATSAAVLAAVSLAASVYTLLYAVVQFFSGTSGTLAKHCVFILVVLAPALTVSFVQQTLGHLALALGNSETRQPLQPLWDQANHLAVPVPVGITIACAVLWALGRKRRRSEMPVGLVAQRIQTFVPYTTIAVAVAVIMRSVALLGYANPAVHISPGEAWLWIGILAAALVIQSAALSFQRGVEVPFTAAPPAT
ncbi:hypothetical protein [Mycobacterium bourgelatii]|uniref:Uncharacterized protein n=1 Tax=Mycobacterium bourgelatii TaxID=1273442 RepID=A0A7I9YPC3_MYCBU|nr:hypothetical protein [Mycobacterium bourgelatii]MCV6973865.1 hypothetical protein [Mycobacterium bourgelatii]GFG90520.1 hypothetical protein MBOU_25620 [Mycobacterium bourgelatii]